MIINYVGIHVKCPLLLLEFNEISLFTTDYGKIITCQIFMKIRPVGLQLFYADGRKDRQDKANTRVSQFCSRA